MKEQYVKGLAEGDAVDTVFALRSRDLRPTRTGESYLSMELADRSGRIPAVMFGTRAGEGSVPVGSVVRVRGTVTTFRGQRRISADWLGIEENADPADLLASGPRDTEELLGFLESLMGEVRHPGLRAVLARVFGDAIFMERFARCPAAQTHHHAYVGGLLEHTVSVAATCQAVGQGYDAIDADLLLAAALLHDVGKVDELAFDTAIEYTDEGRLIGHVVLGERRVAAAVAEAGAAVLPRTVALRLSHVLLSHHGELEWGSPKRPCTLEALVLHHVDNLDAKIAGFLTAVTGASGLEERWTDADNLFRRPLFVPRPVEDDRRRHAEEDDMFCLAAG
jgi:3'-5' exoribonuclease